MWMPSGMVPCTSIEYFSFDLFRRVLAENDIESKKGD